MAFYLKYRPQTLDELLGQEAVKKTLSLAFLSGKLSHAYLLVGPRGTGKTSTARILAKMVNCEKSSDEKSLKADSEASLKTDDYPCNKCSTCLSITDGSNLDLIEIDAASNNSVEDIRLLREKIKLVPTAARKKVYIIDEVHMLSSSAFNALLKTLEEPPAHALFILATTEAQKIPATILSRTQRLDFKLASQEDIKQGLKKIIDSEKLQIKEEALTEIARLADGSFRDGQKLLDQLASLGKKITLEDVLQILRSSKFVTIIELLQLLADKKAKEALLFLNQQMDLGSNAKELNLALLENLRNIILIKNDLGEQLVKSNFSEEKYQQLVKLAGQFKMGNLVEALDSFQQSIEKFKYASIQILPLELAVMEVCASEVMKKDNDNQETIIPTMKTDTQIVPGPDVNKLLEKWNFVLETVRPYNFSLAALLGSVKIISCDGGMVTLEVPYTFHQRILEAPKSKDLLQSVLSDVLEKQILISVVLGDRPIRVEDVANVEIAADDDVVRMASEIFNGTLVD